MFYVLTSTILLNAVPIAFRIGTETSWFVLRGTYRIGVWLWNIQQSKKQKEENEENKKKQIKRLYEDLEQIKKKLKQLEQLEQLE
jgi:hypothetical protein